MATLKWTTGEKYSKSRKMDNPNNKQLQELETKQNENIGELTKTYIFKESHKESVSLRASQREIVHQGIKNPYLGQDYVSDIDIQEKYLKPQNSHYVK